MAKTLDEAVIASRQDYLDDLVYVLSETDLVKLQKALREFAGTNPTFEMTSREITYHFPDLEGVLAYENQPGKEIKSIQITANSADYKKRASITFSESRFNRGIINLSGPLDAITKLNDAIEARLTGMEPWYRRWANVSTSTIQVYVIFMVLWVTVAALVNIFSSRTNLAWFRAFAKTNPFLLLIPGFIFLSLVTYAPVLATSWLDNRRRRYFPAVVFALGQGKQRHDNLEWIRRTVIVGFFVSLSASLGFFLLTFLVRVSRL